jgi:hypothetical protein
MTQIGLDQTSKPASLLLRTRIRILAALCVHGRENRAIDCECRIDGSIMASIGDFRIASICLSAFRLPAAFYSFLVASPYSATIAAASQPGTACRSAWKPLCYKLFSQNADPYLALYIERIDLVYNVLCH